MVAMLGKRKRREQLETAQRPFPTSPDSPSEGDGDLQDAFRRAFEAKFKPLKTSARQKRTDIKHVADGKEGDQGEGSDWEGFESLEDESEQDIVEVVEHRAERKPQSLSKAEAKAFMNSKPPSSLSTPRATKSAGPKDQEDDDDEHLNLKNDLALQRLINESHILDKVKDDGTSVGQRQKRIDLRLQALGSKSSILQQEKMPMSHRKGIIAKASERESRRRREARESGIILEKAARPSKSAAEDKRLRGVGGPSIGKFKGGTLRLSKKDVADIKGPMRKSKKVKSSRQR